MIQRPSRRIVLTAAAAGLAGAAAPSVMGGFGPDHDSILDLPARPLALPTPIAPPLRGICNHDYEDDSGFATARAAGFSFARCDAFWEHVERDGQFDFSAQVELCDRLAARGMKVLFLLNYGHPDYGWDDFTRAGTLEAYRRYARAAAAALRGRGAAFELWNEPDVEEKAYIPPDIFARVLAAGSAGVRAGDPSALVVSGGLSWVDFDYLDPMLAAITALPARPAIDVFGMHFYRNDTPESALPDIEAVRARVAAAFGADMPLWCTEWGYSSADLPGVGRRVNGRLAAHRLRQAALLSRMFLSLWRAGVPRTAWYEIKDGSSDSHAADGNMGLTDFNERAKPTLAAATAFHAAAEGRSLTGVYEGLPGGVRGLSLEGQAGPMAVLWIEEAPGRVRVRVPGENFVEARDMLGAPLAPARAAGAAEIALSEAGGPVYVALRAL
ncbi:MAG: cellulase family glycosylhydrolase [Hyphomonadaceae bacterium]